MTPGKGKEIYLEAESGSCATARGRDRGKHNCWGVAGKEPGIGWITPSKGKGVRREPMTIEKLERTEIIHWLRTLEFKAKKKVERNPPIKQGDRATMCLPEKKIPTLQNGKRGTEKRRIYPHQE